MNERLRIIFCRRLRDGNRRLKDQLKGKGKAVPLQAWTGPEGSRKLRFPDFVTKA